MPTANWKGVLVPEPADGLIDALTKQAESLQVVIPVASIAAARTLLTQAANAGAVISQTKPALFRVGGAEGVYYECVGKNAEGVWKLHPFNEIEVDETTYNIGGSHKAGEGVFSGMMYSKLPTRPYDRVVTVTANAYGSAVGNIDFCLQGQDSAMSLSRWSAGDSVSVAVTNSFTIPAGVTPKISAGVRGGSQGGGTVVTSKDTKLNRMVCVAYPITMD